MFELEAKVPITAKDYAGLLNSLKKEAKYLGSRVNLDSYYDHPKKAFIRMRKRAGHYTFDLKLKQVADGIESNIEMEWGILDPKKWRSLLKKLGLHPSIRKTKTSELFEMSGFTIELNKVKLLGHFLEIERIVTKASELKKAKNELINLFKHLGFSQKDFEERPYLELLKNV